MQHVNNDMDDLFRKAAADYPLNSKNGNWDSVIKKLNEPHASQVVESKPGKRRRFLWLLLLLPFCFFGILYLNKADNKKIDGTSEKTKQNIIAQSPSLLMQNDSLQKNLLLQQEIKNHSVNKTNYDIQFDSKNKSVKNSSLGVTDNNKQGLEKTVEHLSVDNLLNNDGYSLPPQATSELNYNLKDIKSYNIKQNSQPLLIENSVVNADEKLATLNFDSSSHQSKKPSAIKNTQSGLYAGLIAGADASTIKLQSFKSGGYTFGLLAGYHFTKHFSIETGLLWDRKKYYTDGKYFNKSRTTIPDFVTILNMNGSCNMFEIPLNARYNFVQNKKGGFFVAAGLSSYIMKNEKYNYSAEAYGQNYDANKSYNNSTKNWFSIIDVNAGYERSIKNIGNFRIEPYIKLPLKGIGIGSLPVLSTGLNIGITRTLH